MQEPTALGLVQTGFEKLFIDKINYGMTCFMLEVMTLIGCLITN